LKQIADAIEIESNRDLILPITDVVLLIKGAPAPPELI